VFRKVKLWLLVLLLASALALAACEEQTNAGEPFGLDEPGLNEGFLDTEEESPRLEDEQDPVLPDTGDERGVEEDAFVEPAEGHLDPDQMREDLEAGDLYRVRDLLGYSLETRDLNDLGQVRSILVHPETGDIRYLVLDLEDDLQRDGQYVLVPWSALEYGADPRYERDDFEGRKGPPEGIPPGHLPPPAEREPMDCSEIPPGHLPPPDMRDELCIDDVDRDDEQVRYRDLRFAYDRESLADAPAFSEQDLDDLEAGTWEDQVGEYWRGHAGDLPDPAGNYIHIEGEDFRLLDADLVQLGEVTALLFHLPSGQVKYAVVDTSLREGLGLVPFTALEWVESEEAFALAVDRDELERIPYYEDELHLPVSPALE
jgi:hypothetical protein